MQIEYNDRSIRKVCTDASYAEKKYGIQMAEKISLRIDQITATESVEEMIRHHIGRCHKLVGDRKEQYAVDLVHPKRLIFEKKGNEIHIVNIVEIVDYH